ncbi:hypothetical protein [Tunicatimonas pelagia]|uniref:hypothetical protein n=1 Tax=Tunicatimonas pelagia TaxID=931531 RepID=UPI002665E76C|nr:hypothetical protein [Tunicatimonas pelagia]WKN44511.1 hypothetical protein P0M28_05975 [Tunicatimonas pelagia]
MKPSMLAYTKLILEKVSFNRELYEREYRKALTRLSPHEANMLERWTRCQRQQLVPIAVVK